MYFIDTCKVFLEEKFFCSFQNLPSIATLLQWLIVILGSRLAVFFPFFLFRAKLEARERAGKKLSLEEEEERC